MKKILFLISCVILIMPFTLKAETKIGYSNVTGGVLNLRSSANSSASLVGVLYGGMNVEIVDQASGNGCTTWYKIKYNDGYAWGCGVSTSGARNIELYRTQKLRTNQREPENSYEEELKKLGFPPSYWDKLSQLHNDHPTWNFIPDIINRKDFSYITWAETGAVEDNDIDKSLLQAPDGNTDIIAGYLKTDAYNYKTNKFTMQDANYFYAARQDLVAYYMDPRNFLNEHFIFQFEKLSFNKTYHTKSVIENIFGNGYLRQYAQKYVDAGEKNSLSPVHMAARSVQEGLNTENFLTKGSKFIYSGNLYSSMANKEFSNCFNFFNIGAYSDINAAHNAGVYACGGPNRNETSYGRPWNSVDKALNGGAEILSGQYIKVGQDTLYYQKFNTASYTQTLLYAHQYMSNITAVAYEGSDTYDSYNANGLIKSAAFTFVIPVYNNMPEKTSIPSSLSPNNYLSSIKVDGTKIANFDGAKTEGYTVNVINSKTSVKIDTTTVVGSAKVTINNGKEISLNVGNNKIPILVTAANKEQRTYYVNVVREEAPLEIPSDIDVLLKNAGYVINGTYLGNVSLKTTVDNLSNKIINQNAKATLSLKSKSNTEKQKTDFIATSDTLTVSLEGKSKTYTLYVYGDVNGDGLASSADYLMIKDYIMNKYNITGVYKYAADVNRDGNVKSSDYLMIKDYIMNKLSSL